MSDILRLRTLVNAAFTTLNREFTWEELDENFINLLNLVNNAGTEIFPDIAPYDPAVTYSFGVAPRFVSYQNNIYSNISPDDHSGITPGSDPLVWKIESVGTLSHEQNTDIRLGRYAANLDGSVTHDMIERLTFNFFRIRSAGGFSGELQVSLLTIKPGASYNNEFITFVPIAAAGLYTAKFTSDANQEVGPNPLILGPGDWAKWQGNLDGKTKLIASNVLNEATIDTIDELSEDIFPNIQETGTMTVAADDTQLSLPAGTYVENELAGKYLILTYDDLVNYARPIKTIHLIESNTTTGEIVVANETKFAGVPTYQIATPSLVDLDDDVIKAANCTDNIVIIVPAITAVMNRQRLILYREGGNDPDSEYDCFIVLADPILGATEITLVNDGEVIDLRAHTFGMNHWDFFGSNRLCVCLNIAMITPNTTALSNTTDATIKAVTWNLNHPSRFRVKVETDNSITVEYISRVKRNLTVTAVVELVRTAGSPVITVTPQIDSGSGWEPLTVDNQVINLTNFAARDGRTFPVSRGFKFGDKLRFVSRTTTGSYYIENLKIKLGESNA
jgi:hypothetical protein